MAKIKLTKTEMKAQSDALKRFQRFLPMLQLKKQQLQAEIAAIVARIEEVEAKGKQAQAERERWIAIFADGSDALTELVTLKQVVTESSNIAGVTIPVFKNIITTEPPRDLFSTPAWHDDAAEAITAVLKIKAERLTLEKQRELITIELNTTAQRVNLFEKVKIPECKENIRVIKIAIGDEQTASVTRGKIAKNRTRIAAEEDAA